MKSAFPYHFVNNGLIGLLNLSLAENSTPVYTSAQERKKRTCSCQKTASVTADATGSTVTSDGLLIESVIISVLIYICSPPPIQKRPFLFSLSSALLPCMITSFSMKQSLPETKVTRLLLNFAHDAMPYYGYCRDHGIVPFIGLNSGQDDPIFAYIMTEEYLPAICEKGSSTA